MKISTKGRYGLRALTDLAAHLEGEPVSLTSVAKRQNLSLNYLEQVFGTLRKAGIVKSIKGPQGGYLLTKAASGSAVQEILEAGRKIFYCRCRPGAVRDGCSRKGNTGSGLEPD